MFEKHLGEPLVTRSIVIAVLFDHLLGHRTGGKISILEQTRERDLGRAVHRKNPSKNPGVR
jgi:hypothetical protein